MDRIDNTPSLSRNTQDKGLSNAGLYRSQKTITENSKTVSIKLNSNDSNKNIHTPSDFDQIPLQYDLFYPSSIDPTEKKATFLFYMNGQYGDLEQSMASSFLELEKTGSTNNINIAAQLGRAPQREAHPAGGFDRIDNDWSGVRRYHVVKSTAPQKQEIPPERWKEIEENIPDNPLIHYTLGEVYSKLGDTENSKIHYDKAQSLGYELFLDEPFNPLVFQWSNQFDRELQTLRDEETAKNVFESPVAQYMDDVDMMHPHNLQDFVSWGMEKYPAEKYVLVLMGHGGAWTGSMKMSPSELSMAVQSGVHQANRRSGRSDKLDMLVFNSCYMGNLETVDALSETADITVASQMSARTHIFYDWSYLLGKLENQMQEGKPFNPRSFAKDIVEFYRAEGEENRKKPAMARRSQESYLTLTALDNTKIKKLTRAWGKLVKSWKDTGMDDHIMFRNLKNSKNYPSDTYSHDSMFDYGTLRDIGSITINLINDKDVPPQVKRDCYEIRQALRDAIIAEQHTGYKMEGSTGLTVWGPANSADISSMMKAYKDRVPKFVQETGWAEKLEEIVKKTDPVLLRNFMQTMETLTHTVKMMEMPGFTYKEIQNMERKAYILEQEAYQLKKEMDLSKQSEPKSFSSEPEPISFDQDSSIQQDLFISPHNKV